MNITQSLSRGSTGNASETNDDDESDQEVEPTTSLHLLSSTRLINEQGDKMLKGDREKLLISAIQESKSFSEYFAQFQNNEDDVVIGKSLSPMGRAPYDLIVVASRLDNLGRLLAKHEKVLIFNLV